MIEVTVTSHRGFERPANQDRIVVGPWVLGTDTSCAVSGSHPARTLVAVIDGMGGHVAGAVAAGIAARAITSAEPKAVSEAALAAVLVAANDAVYQGMDPATGTVGMGAAAAIAGVDDDGNLVVANAGDVKAFIDTDGYLSQLTVDHIAPATGRLTQSLGGLPSPAPIEPWTASEPFGDRRLLMASDGLLAGAAVGIAEIEAALHANDLTTADRLQALALSAGGPDNISIVLISQEADQEVDEP